MEQITRNGNLDAKLILRQHKLDLMIIYREIKSNNPRMKQNEITKDLGYSSSTLQRQRLDIKLQSPYKSNNPKKCPMTSNDLKRPQKTSNDLKRY